MAHYIDGFVIPLPKKNLAAYTKVARLCAKIWLEHGAIGYCEALADDVKVGKLTSFPRAVQKKATETVIFSWITFKSRKERDRVNAKVLADPRMKEIMGVDKKK